MREVKTFGFLEEKLKRMSGTASAEEMAETLRAFLEAERQNKIIDYIEPGQTANIYCLDRLKAV